MPLKRAEKVFHTGLVYMQDKMNRFVNTKYSILSLLIIPATRVIFDKHIGVIIIVILALFAMVSSILRFKKSKKEMNAYILYYSEFAGIIIFYCLYTFLYDKFVLTNEINIIFNLLSVICIIPIIVEYAKQKATV